MPKVRGIPFHTASERFLHDIFNMLLGNPFRLARGTNSTGSAEPTLGRSLAIWWASQSLDGRYHAAWGHWDLQILR